MDIVVLIIQIVLLLSCFSLMIYLFISLIKSEKANKKVNKLFEEQLIKNLKLLDIQIEEARQHIDYAKKIMLEKNNKKTKKEVK